MDSDISTLTDLIEIKTLPIALRCNINIFDFWNMTLAEITMLIDAYMANKKAEIEMMNTNIYNISFLTASFVGSILTGKKIPTIDEVFPTEENIKEREKQELEKLKNKFSNFAIGHNLQRR